MRQENFEEHMLRAYGISDIGKKRSNNEDSYMLGRHYSPFDKAYSENKCLHNFENGWFCAAVFDGIGGGANGEVASHVAATEFTGIFENVGVNVSINVIDHKVRKAFTTANKKIRGICNNERLCGTTGVVAVTNGEIFKVYHIGDSRAYLMHDDKLFRLTRDQTLAERRNSSGLYLPFDMPSEYEKHVLTDYIGHDNTLWNIKPIESKWYAFEKHDKILLCSDGLYDMCGDMVIGHVMRITESPERMAGLLVDNSLDLGGRDNITCVVFAK